LRKSAKSFSRFLEILVSNFLDFKLAAQKERSIFASSKWNENSKKRNSVGASSGTQNVSLFGIA